MPESVERPSIRPLALWLCYGIKSLFLDSSYQTTERGLEVAHPPNPAYGGPNPTRFQPSEVELAIGYTFRNRRLLEQALTHAPTPAGEKDTSPGTKLSWLGDALLHLVVSDLLFRTYPNSAKEELQKTRSKLTQHGILAGIGSTLGIEKFGRLGPPPLEGNVAAVKDQHQTIANILVALFGAIYVDAGAREAQRVILHCLKKRFEHIQSFKPHRKKTDTAKASMPVRPHITNFSKN